MMCKLGILNCTGAPLPPSLQYEVIDENTLEVLWEEPFTTEGFPITSYYLRVVDGNQTNETALTDIALSADTFSFNVTRMVLNSSSCTNLTFQLWAENSVANSSIGVTYGTFPSGKLILISICA